MNNAGEITKQKNFARGHAEYVFWPEILYPAFLVVLLVLNPRGKIPPGMALSVGSGINNQILAAVE